MKRVKKMTDETQTTEIAPEAKAKRNIVRGPQEVLAFVTVHDAAGNELNLNDFTVAVELAKPKDVKAAMSKIKSMPNAAVLDLEVPKAG